MSFKRKWLIGSVLFAIVLLAALILFLVIKPEFLEEIFEKNQEASITPGASSQAKATNNPGPNREAGFGSSPAPTRVSLSGETSGFPDYSAYYAKLPGELSQSPMVGEIPKGETILLRFYNFNTGYREFEKSYLLTTGNVKEGFFDVPEITIVVHSKYVPELNKNNLCDTISKADTNNDVGIYTDLSTTKLIMKFKGMIKYKDCLL